MPGMALGVDGSVVVHAALDYENGGDHHPFLPGGEVLAEFGEAFCLFELTLGSVMFWGGWRVFRCVGEGVICREVAIHVERRWTRGSVVLTTASSYRGNVSSTAPRKALALSGVET